jgi:two-component system, sensor histidine kinase PdtaS
VQTLPELARTHTDLLWHEIAHLKRLTGSWGFLADFSFSDLLLLAPVAGSDGHRFVVLGQLRPTTGQTMYQDDLVGHVFDEAERPIAGRGWRTREITEGSIRIPSLGGSISSSAGAQGAERHGDERVFCFCVPVVFQDRAIAVLSRDAPTTALRRSGELERVYQEIFDRFARMIAAGAFPYPGDDAEPEDGPRVGDGCMLVEADGRVRYMSPNAMSALHRLGIHANVKGLLLSEVGFADGPIQRALATGVPELEETERGDTSIIVRVIPIIAAGVPDGAVVLVRDVSDVRRRDRMLVSKDATIREIHHRVKNNLQTIAALLRLQSRRLESPEAKLALEESTRRIGSIALVHETLSRASGDVVPFDEVVRPLVRMVEDALTGPDRRIRFSLTGDAGELAPEVATPLAVVLNELMQNAVDHAFPPGWTSTHDDGDAHIDVSINRVDDDRLIIDVHDDGVGFPEGFAHGASTGLGLSIVQTLVTTELGGALQLGNDGAGRGARTHIEIPLRDREG